MARHNSRSMRVDVHHHGGCMSVVKWLLIAFVGLLTLGTIISLVAPPRRPAAATVQRKAGLIKRWNDARNKVVVEFERQRGVPDAEAINLLYVTFSRPLPPPAAVDRIVLEFINKAVAEDDSREILAAAMIGDEVLPSPPFSDQKVWNPVTRKVKAVFAD